MVLVALLALGCNPGRARSWELYDSVRPGDTLESVVRKWPNDASVLVLDPSAGRFFSVERRKSLTVSLLAQKYLCTVRDGRVTSSVSSVIGGQRHQAEKPAVGLTVDELLRRYPGEFSVVPFGPNSVSSCLRAHYIVPQEFSGVVAVALQGRSYSEWFEVAFKSGVVTSKQKIELRY